MPYLELPDCNLFYTIDDHTDAWTKPETVLFVHGFTETGEAWRAWVPHFSRRYRMVRIDQRGFGRSGAVAKGIAAHFDRSPVRGLGFNDRFDALERFVFFHFDALGGESFELRIVVALGLELRKRELPVVQDDGRRVMRGQQRFELAFVTREDAVHLVGGLAHCHAHFSQVTELDRVLLDEIEKRRDHALYRRRRRPR